MNKINFLAIALLLTGCATPYKPNGFAFNGGFDSVELEPNYFRVTFKGNEKTSRDRANDFALLRVSDLMLERGCTSFAVIKSSSDVKKSGVYIPAAQTTSLTTTTFGSTATTHMSTNPGIGLIGSLEFPKAIIEAKCSNKTPDVAQDIYDSKFINESLRTKYKVKPKG